VPGCLDIRDLAKRISIRSCNSTSFAWWGGRINPCLNSPSRAVVVFFHVLFAPGHEWEKGRMETGGGPEVCVRKERMAVLLPGKSQQFGWWMDVQCFVDELLEPSRVLATPATEPRYHVMCFGEGSNLATPLQSYCICRWSYSIEIPFCYDNAC
jgi:hypothetical protein